MPIEVYEVREGQRIDQPSGDVSPAASGQGDAPGAGQTDAPGATPAPPAGGHEPSDSPPDTSTTPAPGGEPGAGDSDDDEPLRDDSEVNAERLNRRFARLTQARRKAERERDALAQQHQVELAQTRGQLEVMQRMLSGAAPDVPQTPAQPTGPPHAEQFEHHEDYVMAAARYGAQQVQQERDQLVTEAQRQAQQQRFQQDLVTREQAFKQAHPDFDSVVRSGLAGKVSPVLQQALMLVPDGPAVAYALARQPDTVQRLNSLPPPLVLVELGKLTPASPSAVAPAVGSTNGNGTAPLPAPTLHAPETPLSGGGAGAPTGAYREDFTAKEYAQWRKRTSQLAAWKER